MSPPKQLKFSEFLCKERNRWGVGRREKRDTLRSSAPSLVAEIKVVLVPPCGRNPISALHTCQCTRPLWLELGDACVFLLPHVFLGIPLASGSFLSYLHMATSSSPISTAPIVPLSLAFSLISLMDADTEDM